MNILVVGRTLPTNKTGSYGTFEFEQAQALSKKENTGFLFLENSSILTNRKIKKINRIHQDIPIVGFYLPIKGLPRKLYDFIKAKLFINMYEQFVSDYWKPDIVHIHYPLLTVNSRIIDYLKSQNVKLFATEHWSKVQKKEISANQKKLLEKIFINTNKLICVSEPLQQSITEMINTSSNNPIVIPNMIDDIFFGKNYSYKKNAEEFIFTFIGMLTDVKQVNLLIKAFQNTFKENKSVKLVIIGDGPLRNRLEKQADSNDNIRFVGWKAKNEVQSYLMKTSVYVSASVTETFGVPFIEALAIGIPVIGADNLPIKKYINKHNGVLFKVGDEVDLQEKMWYLYSNRQYYDENAIRDSIERKFSTEVISNKIITTYKEN